MDSRLSRATSGAATPVAPSAGTAPSALAAELDAALSVGQAAPRAGSTLDSFASSGASTVVTTGTSSNDALGLFGGITKSHSECLFGTRGAPRGTEGFPEHPWDGPQGSRKVQKDN